MRDFKVEVCVESLEEAKTAVNKGADGLELCANLEKDGLTPSRKLIDEVLNFCKVPLKVMIRPRPGDFIYNAKDIIDIQRDLMDCQNLGVEEIVFGAIKNGRLNIELIKQIAQWAMPMKITIHKAIDASNDPLNDIEILKSIPNIIEVLSSGQKRTAKEGMFMLQEMKNLCVDKIQLIPAGKITPNNLHAIHAQLGANKYHGRKIL